VGRSWIPATPIKEQLSLVLPIAAECSRTIQTIKVELQAAFGSGPRKVNGPLAAQSDFYTANA
jgi:hypothetical protein